VRVLIVAAQIGQSEEGRFILHHQLDDVLNRAFGLFEAYGPAAARIFDQVAERSRCFQISAFGQGLPFLFQPLRAVR